MRLKKKEQDIVMMKLNSISKHGRMREFYTYDYNNNKSCNGFSEEINDLNFHLEDNFNSKFYKSIELSDYDRKNISKLLDTYFMNKRNSSKVLDMTT